MGRTRFSIYSTVKYRRAYVHTQDTYSMYSSYRDPSTQAVYASYYSTDLTVFVQNDTDSTYSKSALWQGSENKSSRAFFDALREDGDSEVESLQFVSGNKAPMIGEYIL